jgi:hypothetical protein
MQVWATGARPMCFWLKKYQMGLRILCWIVNAEWLPVDKFRFRWDIFADAVSLPLTKVQPGSPSAMAFAIQLLVGHPLLNTRRKPTDFINLHPANLSVGFRTPGSEQRGFRTPPLTTVPCDSGREKVPSHTSQIPGIQEVWGLLSFCFQLRAPAWNNKGSSAKEEEVAHWDDTSHAPLMKPHHSAGPLCPLGLFAQWSHVVDSDCCNFSCL